MSSCQQEASPRLAAVEQKVGREDGRRVPGPTPAASRTAKVPKKELELQGAALNLFPLHNAQAGKERCLPWTNGGS